MKHPKYSKIRKRNEFSSLKEINLNDTIFLNGQVLVVSGISISMNKATIDCAYYGDYLNSLSVQELED